MRKPISLVSSTPMSVAKPSKAAAPTARPPERPPASMRLEIVTPSGNLCRKIAMNTMIPSSGRTRNALAIATPSKNVCSSSPISAEVPATELTAWVSSPKWKCGVTVCWVRCTARYPARTSAGATGPLLASASGRISTIATESMNPAPNATKCSMSLSSLVARRVTARAPSTLPSAATSAYTRALDTGQEILLGVLGRVVEHLAQQAFEHLAHVGAGTHAGGDQIVTLHGEVLERQRRIGGANGRDRFHDARGRQLQQIVDVLPHLRQPVPHHRGVFRVGITVPPLPDRAAALDILVGALESRQERCRIGGEERGDQDGIPGEGQLVELLFPLFPVPADLGQPDTRRADVHPQGE